MSHLELTHDDEQQLVHPLTGEAIELRGAPDHFLARFLSDLRESEWQLREAKKIVSEEALRRMDQAASWTLRTEDGYTLKGASPAPSEEYDALALRSELLELADLDVISPAAVDAAVEPVITYKARKAGINALRKLGGQVAETVARHCRTVEKSRYVSVEGP